MTYKITLTLFILAIAGPAMAQKPLFHDSIMVEAKAWSRDSLRNIRYSDWKSHASHTTDMINGFSKGKADKLSRYGGDAARQFKATGFFRTEKIEGRWLVIDPEGHPFIVSAVNSFRQGKSPDNQQAFTAKFGTDDRWTEASVNDFRALGFNMAGCWGDTAAIRAYNIKATRPFPYCTQLNMLSGYMAEAKKKNPSRKEYPALSFITDAGFAAYCDRVAEKIAYLKDDPNLFGHFSDNEIAFMHAEFAKIIAVADSTDACRRAAIRWMREKGLDPALATREQKEAFISTLTRTYYRTVSSAIRKHDPGHLYLGSRLHSTAKDNPYLFKSAHPYVDIVSINYYGYWAPLVRHMNDWAAWSDRPFFITEFYTKAMDSGLPNISGAGWLVRTQRERGIHYQNFCIELMRSPHNVGWHWFRYQDNDPADPTADPSNNDSNKGLVDKRYKLHTGMTDVMKELNDRKYRLSALLLKANR
jgi:hypothetical protein